MKGNFASMESGSAYSLLWAENGAASGNVTDYVLVRDAGVDFKLDPGSASSFKMDGDKVSFAAYSYEATERLIKMFEFAALVLRDLQECGGYRLCTINEVMQAAHKATGIDPSKASADEYAKWVTAERRAMWQAMRQRPSSTELMERINNLAYGPVPSCSYGAEDTDW